MSAALPITIGLFRLDLRADAATTFPAAPVVALHAALHRALEMVDPPLATATHDAPVKPLTLSPLFRGPDETPVAGAVAVGERVWARLGVLDGALLPPLLLALATDRPLALDGRQWRIEAVAPVVPPGASLPAPTTYADLAAAATPAAELTLRFASPTVFRNKGYDLLQPEPRLVFGSLLRRWRAFAPPGLLDLDDERLIAAVALADARLAVQAVDLGRRRQAGFVGWARFRVDGDAACRTAVAALAAYAAYAGTGARTALGMGQTVRLR